VKLKVLIAEDEAIIRLDLREILEECGYKVIAEVGDGRSAVELAKKLKPDVVILDIKMPVLDGLTAARQITEASICPVLILTAFSQKSLVEEAAKAGALAYLVKPFDKSDLIPALEVARARFQEKKFLEQQVKNLQERLETRRLVEQAKGLLMARQGLKEAEAFRLIQKTSMESRRPIKEIALEIINKFSNWSSG
jgi:response regulator NasT